MDDDRKTIRKVVKGLAYGLLIGWAVGMVWWASLVFVFGLESSIVTIIDNDSTGWQPTYVTASERFALVPVRAIPWAVIAGMLGAVVEWNRRRHRTVEGPKTMRRMVTGLAYGLLVGWIAAILVWTPLVIALGPSTSTYEHRGIAGVEYEQHFTPVLETIALSQQWAVVCWTVVTAVVGAIIGGIGGTLEAITSFSGMISGVGFALTTSLLGGWLVNAIPVCAFVGTVVGLAGALLVRLLIGRIRVRHA